MQARPPSSPKPVPTQEKKKEELGRKGGKERAVGERKRGPSGQNERGGLSSCYFVFFYFKALFKLISKAFEFVLNFDQNHTSQ